MSRLLTYSYSIVFLAAFWSENVFCKDNIQPTPSAPAILESKLPSGTELLTLQSRPPLKHELDGIKAINFERLNNSVPSKKMQLGGGSSNGGGSGVACLNNQTVSLEQFELSHLNSMIPALQNENALAYLNRVLAEKMKPLSPLFYKRLQVALDLMFKNAWVTMTDEQMPVYDDAGEIKAAIPGDCQRVQIFIRHSNLHEGAVTPEITMFYNPNYFNSLSVQAQAVMLVHEALYVMGSELGHPDSANVRKMAILLLSKDFYAKFNDPSIAESPREKYIVFMTILDNLEFNAHIDLFQKPLFASSSASARREKSFIQLVHKMIRFGFKDGDRSRPQAISSDFLHELIPSLTEEESFMYLAMTLMNYPKAAHVETFTIDSQPAQSLRPVCTLIESIYLRLPPAAQTQPNFLAFKKAVSYCQSN